MIGLVGTLVILVAGLASGLLRWSPAEGNRLVLLATALIVPGLAEEIVFRGLLTPAKGETDRPVLVLALGLAAFVLWHVVQARLVPTATLFLGPAFLLCAGLLGLACALMRYHTGSLWPAVLFHGAVVWVWQTFLGGPRLTELLGA